MDPSEIAILTIGVFTNLTTLLFGGALVASARHHSSDVVRKKLGLRLLLDELDARNLLKVYRDFSVSFARQSLTAGRRLFRRIRGMPSASLETGADDRSYSAENFQAIQYLRYAAVLAYLVATLVLAIGLYMGAVQVDRETIVRPIDLFLIVMFVSGILVCVCSFFEARVRIIDDQLLRAHYVVIDLEKKLKVSEATTKLLLNQGVTQPNSTYDPGRLEGIRRLLEQSVLPASTSDIVDAAATDRDEARRLLEGVLTQVN